MNNQVNNEASAEEVLAVQASLLIPIIITIFCSALDIIFQLELAKVQIISFKQGASWLLTTLISYFFPSFFAGAITLFWQYYFAGGYSGIKKGKGFLLGMSIIVYFFFYIVYLLCSERFLYTLFFTILNVAYAYFVITNEYSRAVTPLVRQTGNRLSRPTETACASLLAQIFIQAIYLSH